MRAITFIKRFTTLLLAFAIMLPYLVSAQADNSTDFIKISQGKQEEKHHGKKITPKMMQMQRAVKSSQSILPAGDVRKAASSKNSYRAPLAVTESGATLFGNLIYHSQWLDFSQAGYYSINPNTGEYTSVGTDELLAGAGTVVDGIAYVSYAETYMGISVINISTIVYDVENGEIIKIIDYGADDYSNNAVNMAYNYTDDMIYAITYNENGSLYRLSSFDRDTYTYTKIVDFPENYDIYAMTFDPNGTLYMIFGDGSVKEVSHTTGEIIREICDTGFKPLYMQSACWSPKDNKILWAASNEDESHILAVDVTTNTTETLCTFNNSEEWVSLYTTDAIASDDAPQKPHLAVYLGSKGSLEGDILIAAPSTTIAGNTLSADDLSLVIELNGEEIYNEEITPSQEIILPSEFKEGKNIVRTYAVNSAGKGHSTFVKKYAGHDTPLPVTGLEVEINDEGLATLTWNAPTGGVNNGYVDLTALTYKIERLGKVIATDITGTSYTDQLPEEIGKYKWTVYAIYNDKKSKPTHSKEILFGNALTLPYEQSFDYNGCIDFYTIVDGNNDNKTWSYESSKSALQYTYHTNNQGDDYAITPPIRLTNEKTISIEINVQCYMSQYPERIEITLGKSPNPAEHTAIMPNTDITWDKPQTIRTLFSVEEEGIYYIGLHATSNSGQYYLLVKDIKITESSSLDAPKAIENVTATPGANGTLTATLTFTAPTESLKGETLTEDITVTAYRNEEVIGTATCTPGGTGNIIDNNANNGINEYALVTSNSAGNGDRYDISLYAGIDIPSIVTNVKFTTAEDNMSSVITWEAPTTGMNGGYINTEELIYTIYISEANSSNITPIGETTDLSYEVSVDDTNLKEHYYYVSAKNIAGESYADGGRVVLGKPYNLPFVEQIEETTIEHSPWFTIYDEDSYANWELTSSMENYNLPEAVTAPDGGMFVCYDSWEYNNATCGLSMPKIFLAGANAPTLYFSMYHYNTASDFNELSVNISTNDNTYKKIFAKKVNDATQDGWAEYQVSLDEYKDAIWIAIRFDATISANGFIFLDYIIVENDSENDAMVSSVTAPLSTAVGEEIEITANIFNKGRNAASFEVAFFVNDKKIETVSDTGLASYDSNDYTVKFTPKADHIGSMIIKAVVSMTGDEVAANNAATTKTTVTQPYLPVVTDLAGEENNGTAVLTWSEPIIAGNATLDDMEKYESWIIDDIGDYINIDADDAVTYYTQGYDYPHINEPKAWQVWAPSELGLSLESWMPYSGDKCLIAFSTITGSGAANDWFISPEITGGTEMSFWANIPTNQYGAETFEILYSTTDTDINSFELLSSEAKNTAEWERFTYILPNDAKYFAIRYTSTDIFAMLIDDLSYVSVHSTSDLIVVGYNVYCNGEKLNDIAILDTTYETTLTDAAFNVSVVYNEGESLFSNTVNIGAVGIEDVNELGINIYGQDDYIKIKNVAGRMVSIYTVDGRVVYNAKATDNDILIPANLGVYIVNIDNTASCKVFVR